MLNHGGLSAMKYRKVVQISGAGGGLFCLCDDGTIWAMNTLGTWSPIKNPSEIEIEAPSAING